MLFAFVEMRLWKPRAVKAKDVVTQPTITIKKYTEESPILNIAVGFEMMINRHAHDLKLKMKKKERATKVAN